jgi:hypothetical protein
MHTPILATTLSSAGVVTRLDEAIKGIKLAGAAEELEQAQDSFRQSFALDVDGRAVAVAGAGVGGSDPTLEVQQLLKDQIGVEVQVVSRAFHLGIGPC